MYFKKYNFIFQIIFYFLFNIFSLQLIKASIPPINEIPQNSFIEKSNPNNLQEDLYLLGAGDSLIFSVIGAEELRSNTKILNLSV